MPFDNTAQTALLDDTGKLKYDLRTGKGRLLYLADQLMARRPADFDMTNWEQCAIGEASRIPALVALGLPAVDPVYGPSGGFPGLSAFFDITFEQADKLFGGDCDRTVLGEARVLRKVAKAMT